MSFLCRQLSLFSLPLIFLQFFGVRFELGEVFLEILELLHQLRPQGLFKECFDSVSQIALLCGLYVVDSQFIWIIMVDFLNFVTSIDFNLVKLVVCEGQFALSSKVNIQIELVQQILFSFPDIDLSLQLSNPLLQPLGT